MILYCYDLDLHAAAQGTFPSVSLNLDLCSSFLSLSGELDALHDNRWSPEALGPHTHTLTHSHTHRAGSSGVG